MAIRRSARRAPALGDVIEAHARLRARRPLVQCLTNVVSANFVANALLAVGASPAMVDNPQEAAGFAGFADAVLINLGTPTEAQVASMRLAAEAADGADKPWVLDPVAAGALPWRGGIAVKLLSYYPAIIRGNASEIIGLAGLEGGRGVDSSADPADAVTAAAELLEHASAVSASGAVDHVVGRVGDAGEIVLVRVGGGSGLLPRVTATGCALGALSAAYAAVSHDPFTALVAAHVHFAVAAEIAADSADRPGSFATAFLDALDAVDEAALAARARIEAPETL
ncbi:MAG: hydroxyethylthiazole kinase [Proteobacteria bacterium]|nr:hydroxyethylthiazole kinase [Pseudomonadota bacterium]